MAPRRLTSAICCSHNSKYVCAPHQLQIVYVIGCYAASKVTFYSTTLNAHSRQRGVCIHTHLFAHLQHLHTTEYKISDRTAATYCIFRT